MKKIRKSSGLHIWNDHSGVIQVEDMKENSIFIMLRLEMENSILFFIDGFRKSKYCYSEEHCPMTYHREIKKLLPTAVIFCHLET